MGPLGHGWENLSAEEAQRRATIIFGRWLTLVRGLVGSHEASAPTTSRSAPTERRRGPHRPGDPHRLRRRATRTLRETTIPELWHLLHNPTEDLITRSRYATRQQFLDETRLLRNALGQLVNGTLAGLFDDAHQHRGRLVRARSSRCPCRGSTTSVTRRWASRCWR